MREGPLRKHNLRRRDRLRSGLAKASLHVGSSGVRNPLAFLRQRSGGTDEQASYLPGLVSTAGEAASGADPHGHPVYLRADDEDMSILDGRDDQKRAELIAERLRHWKSITNA